MAVCFGDRGQITFFLSVNTLPLYLGEIGEDSFEKKGGNALSLFFLL